MSPLTSVTSSVGLRRRTTCCKVSAAAADRPTMTMIGQNASALCASIPNDAKTTWPARRSRSMTRGVGRRQRVIDEGTFGDEQSHAASGAPAVVLCHRVGRHVLRGLLPCHGCHDPTVGQVQSIEFVWLKQRFDQHPSPSAGLGVESLVFRLRRFSESIASELSHPPRRQRRAPPTGTSPTRPSCVPPHP